MCHTTRVALVHTVALVLLLAGPFGAPTLAQTGGNVLVVVNAASADSAHIGEYYAQKRAVPEQQILRLAGLPADPSDGIDRSTFERAIQEPIARWLAQHQAQDRVLFIVLTKHVPVRINGGDDRSAASVDSELAVLYLRMTGATVPLAGPLPNPYFAGDGPTSQMRPFSREAFPIYLVTRLDGFSVADVLGLIDRGAAPSRTGRFVLDGKLALPSDKGNAWLRVAAERLATGLTADRIVHDASAAVLTDQRDVLGYYSWGSNDPAIRRRRFGLAFQPGAIGGMFVSTDGRTFREPPDDWALANWNDKSTWFAGSPQSLAGDLIREGITGVAGHVSEPLLGHTIRPNVLFPAYVAGFSLAEAFYLAMPSLSWMTVVVGDPLCAPFADTVPRREDPPIDPTTELPTYFSQRRLESLSKSAVPIEVQRLLLRADSRGARGEEAAARADLERATVLFPTLVGAQLALASKYELSGNYDAAIARYRKILELDPDSAIALNNLAYALAVRKGELRESLSLADRARTLAPQSGVIADTVGWIHFMSGNAARALVQLAEAVRLDPDNAEIHLHLAQVRAALGDLTASKTALARALELDPLLASRAEVRTLQGR